MKSKYLLAYKIYNYFRVYSPHPHQDVPTAPEYLLHPHSNPQGGTQTLARVTSTLTMMLSSYGVGQVGSNSMLLTALSSLEMIWVLVALTGRRTIVKQVQGVHLVTWVMQEVLHRLARLEFLHFHPPLMITEAWIDE